MVMPPMARPPNSTRPRIATSTHTRGLVLRAPGTPPEATGWGAGAGDDPAGGGDGAAFPDAAAAGVPHWLQNAPATDAPHFVQKGMKPPLRYSSASRMPEHPRFRMMGA